MPMQPSPSTDTVGPLRPSLRVFMSAPLANVQHLIMGDEAALTPVYRCEGGERGHGESGEFLRTIFAARFGRGQSDEEIVPFAVAWFIRSRADSSLTPEYMR